MRWLYNFGKATYHTAVRAASPFHPKARKWVKGRNDNFDKLASVKQSCIWMHCASLGEFEQGKPVLEALLDAHPELDALVTFFSPSGYEIRKNYERATVVYLPQANRANANRFFETLNIQLSIFVKYEFWLPYLEGAKQRNIPIVLIAGVFRADQPFFKWYGAAWRTMLTYFDAIYVQQQASATLLQNIGIEDAIVAGDPRFDRVLQTIAQPKTLPIVEAFSKGNHTLILGSSWQKEEALTLQYLKQNGADDLKVIIAPHDVSEARLTSIEDNFYEYAPVRYSDADLSTIINCKILLIDCIGLLASIYQHGTLAFVGGGYRKALHNILEAAAYGQPVLFGPQHKNFPEAAALIAAKGGFDPSDQSAFDSLVGQLLGDASYRNKTGENARQFVHQHKGATHKMVKDLSLMLKA